MQSSKLTAALAYVFWVPAIYIVLSKLRKDEFTGFHGGQALLLWLIIFAGFFTLRWLVNLVWGLYYIPYLDLIEVLFASAAWGYAVACGYRCAQGEVFRLPH
jgi:uncharacterized membrane protein